MRDIALHRFDDLDAAPDVASYVAALEAFDAIPQIQELKSLARADGNIGPGRTVLDVGCGFGLETLRLARAVGRDGIVFGLDKSRSLLDIAERRAAALNLVADFRHGEATALPFGADTFDAVRAERVLIYLSRPEDALAEMVRVLQPGGRLALIEPEFASTTVNISDRSAAGRALAHEAETAVATNWLPGKLYGLLRDFGLASIRVETRVAIFPPSLGAIYFSGIGQRAAEAGVLTEGEGTAWQDEIEHLHRTGRLFGHVSTFLFLATKRP